MFALTPQVEPVSIDEAFLDLTGTTALHKMSPAQSLNRLTKRVEADIGVTVSVGLSHNKFLAKLASDLDKPRGFSIIGKAETAAFLAQKSVWHDLGRRQGDARAAGQGRHPDHGPGPADAAGRA